MRGSTSAGSARWLVHGLVLLLLGSVVVAPAAAQTPVAQSTTILTVVSGSAEVQTPGRAAFAPAADEQVVAVGTRVRTPAEGRAVLTFADGTTATLDPNTEVVVGRIDSLDPRVGSLRIGMELGGGRLWVQVTSLIDIGSRFVLQAGDVTTEATAGVSGFRKTADDTLTCWVIAGQPTKMTSPAGTLELAAGQEITLTRGQGLSAAVPRRFSPGLLEIQTDGAMLARVVTPQNLTVGFPLDDLVVNQVVDATTSVPGTASPSIRIPGPQPGDYRVLLEPRATGAYEVRIRWSRDGETLLAQEWRGTARPGQQLVAELSVEGPNGGPPTVTLGTVHPLIGRPPGRFVYP